MQSRKRFNGSQRGKPKIIHAQIKSPVFVRKTILEASILSLENIKILKNIMQIKRRKGKLKADLRKECKEMRDLVTEFENMLPSPSDVGMNVQRESEKELTREAREEEKRRFKQEKLIVKASEKDEVFGQRSELDFDIQKLKEKIRGL